MSSTLLTATEFARVCQVTPRTIRWYQEKGLLTPVKIDEWTKYAYFSPEQSLLVFRIKLLQQFNLPLVEIKAMLTKRSVSLDNELKRLDQFIKEKQEELRFLKEMNVVLGEGKSLLKREAVGPYILLAHKIENGDYYKLDEYIDQLRTVAKDLGLKVQDSEVTFYLDTNLEYKPKGSNLEVCLVISGNNKAKMVLPKDYYLKDFPKTEVLAALFKGPYAYLSLFYAKIDSYIKKKKIKLVGPVFEIYLKNPIITKSPYEYLTKICYPLASHS